MATKDENHLDAHATELLSTVVELESTADVVGAAVRSKRWGGRGGRCCYRGARVLKGLNVVPWHVRASHIRPSHVLGDFVKENVAMRLHALLSCPA